MSLFLTLHLSCPRGWPTIGTLATAGSGSIIKGEGLPHAPTMVISTAVLGPVVGRRVCGPAGSYTGGGFGKALAGLLGGTIGTFLAPVVAFALVVSFCFE